MSKYKCQMILQMECDDNSNKQIRKSKKKK